MKLYVYKINYRSYVTISDSNSIGGNFSLTINEAINEYFKNSWNMSQDDYWSTFIAKNKPVLVIDSEINPEYFI